MTIDPPCREATPEDSAVMADLVNIAGEGMPLYLWEKMAQEPGQDASAWEIGEQRAKREAGGFSYRNTILRCQDGAPVAALIGYPIDPEPDPQRFDGLPEMFVPLQELEDMVLGSWYVNVLATLEKCRGKGYGTELLAVAEQLAAKESCDAMSLIVNDVNEGARRLYGRIGYEEVAQRPIIKENWVNPGSHWVLLSKPL